MMRERTTLQTRRLLLRPYRVEDADDLFAVQSDEEFVRYLLDAWPTREGIAEGLARIVAAPVGENPIFAIVLDGRVIGGINLIIDDRVGLGMLNYGIAQWVRGRGLATEAAAAVVEYGFRVCGLAKVWARVDPRNLASVRVLEKLGMQKEGLLRGVAVRHGERSDRLYVGLLREEWERGHTSLTDRAACVIGLPALTSVMPHTPEPALAGIEQ